MQRNGLFLTIRALCDNGSQVNLITQAAVQKLDLKPYPELTTFTGVGGNDLGCSMDEIMLTIQLRNGKLIAKKFYVVKHITNYFPKTNTTDWDNMKHQLADEHYSKPGKVQALLGVGIWIQIIDSGVIKSENKLAVAHKTKLGYVILENEEASFRYSNPFIGSINKVVSLKQLMNQIQKLWEIEEIPTIKKRSKEEELCEQIFVSTHTRDKHGRYIVRIPFDDKIKTLGKSKRIALKQFFGMEKRMKRDDAFATKYRSFMFYFHSKPNYDR